MLRPAPVPGGFEAFTREVIERVRTQPIYLSPPSEKVPSVKPLPDAAVRLRAETTVAGT
jgi:hypothetical protein